MSTSFTSNRAAVSPALDEKHYAFGSRGYAWLVCLLLSGLQIVSNMERQILNLVVEPLRRDFHIQDVQVSILQGIAFALFYAIVAVPVGWLADRWRRDRIIMIGMGLWAVSTLGCMIAQSFSMLFTARLLIGLADASLVPASLSLLSDYFPRAKLAGPVGALTGATFLGSGIALTFGGMLLTVLPVNSAVSLPVFGAIHGWQLSFGIMCLLGLVLTLAMLAVREPPRRDRAGEAELASHKARLFDVLRYMGGHMPYLGNLLGGLVLLGTYQYGLSAWAVTMFIRVHGWSVTQIGFIYGLYMMILGDTRQLCRWTRFGLVAIAREGRCELPGAAGGGDVPYPADDCVFSRRFCTGGGRAAGRRHVLLGRLLRPGDGRHSRLCPQQHARADGGDHHAAFHAGGRWRRTVAGRLLHPERISGSSTDRHLAGRLRRVAARPDRAVLLVRRPHRTQAGHSGMII